MIDILKMAATEGSKVLLKYFRNANLDIIQKGSHQNIVTKADKESQEIIQKSILRGMLDKGVKSSSIGFIGEEDLRTEGVHEHSFVIDPLDGTSNFASGLDYFCISIGYFQEGVLQAGIILRPCTSELYYAEKGSGAHVERDGKKMIIKMRNPNTQNTFIITEAWNKVQEDQQLIIADTFLKEARGLRILGAIALDLMFLAEDTASLVISQGPLIWDIAAAKIILNEAGAELYNLYGDDVVFDLKNVEKRYQLFACNRRRKEEVLKKIKLSGVLR